MSNRSLLGLFLLLLAASCAPPPAAHRSELAAASPAAHRVTAPDGAVHNDPAVRAAPMNVTQEPAGLSLSPAPPFAGAIQDDDSARRSLDCLTAAVYYEARSEPADGQRAVAQVVLNRVRHPGFPSSVCGVVYQGAGRAGCQFSFVCDGSMALPLEPAAWLRARRIAQAALDGSVYAPAGLATYYHANSVLPWWARTLDRVATIGSQIFYRWRGQLGDALAFHQAYSGVELAAAGEPPTEAASAAPVVVRYALGDQATVAVHRGASASGSASGVWVHRGSEIAESTQDMPVALVKVHRAS